MHYLIMNTFDGYGNDVSSSAIGIFSSEATWPARARASWPAAAENGLHVKGLAEPARPVPFAWLGGAP